MFKPKSLSVTCAGVLTVTLSACSTLSDQQCPVAERAVEYINRQVPDAYLAKCLPRVLQADVNPNGDPQAAVVVIRTNNGRLDECRRLHKLLIDHILEDKIMPDDSKPDLPEQKKTPTQESETK